MKRSHTNPLLPLPLLLHFGISEKKNAPLHAKKKGKWQSAWRSRQREKRQAAQINGSDRSPAPSYIHHIPILKAVSEENKPRPSPATAAPFLGAAEKGGGWFFFPDILRKGK